ncbi:MAG: hypothetical protein L3J93_00295 [Thermoplasmata archaeon]|nr:hypothetical protein [Thermoplasmata archaeon]
MSGERTYSACAVPEEREHNEDGVLSAGGEHVLHDPTSLPSEDEAFLLHLNEPTGQHPGSQSWVAPEELTKSAVMTEGHVPKQEQRPAPPELVDALPERINGASPSSDLRGTPHEVRSVYRGHYPSGP